METISKRFAKYAWFVLGYNILVILWGVFLRASKSGDGCGQHWLTCGGEVVPSAPQLKTVIEFTHRIMSASDGLLMIGLLGWAIYIWRTKKTTQTKAVFTAAAIAFVFVLIEGGLGAGLVLTGNTAETLTPARPFWMAAHLLNTLILLSFLTATAWIASTGRTLSFANNRKLLLPLAVGVGVIFLIGISGSIAALTSMIFPSETLVEGLEKDFSSTSHMLLRLRPFHPLVAVLGSVALTMLGGWFRRQFADEAVAYWVRALAIVILVQVTFGAFTLLFLGPILMQLGHLLLADAVWIIYIFIMLNVLSKSDD